MAIPLAHALEGEGRERREASSKQQAYITQKSPDKSAHMLRPINKAHNRKRNDRWLLSLLDSGRGKGTGLRDGSARGRGRGSGEVRAQRTDKQNAGLSGLCVCVKCREACRREIIERCTRAEQTNKQQKQRTASKCNCNNNRLPAAHTHTAKKHAPLAWRARVTGILLVTTL